MTEQQPNYTDQTIQWARESLQRRRKELQAKKKSLVASYKQTSSSNDDEVGSSSQQSTSQQQEEANDVTAMLERGRALLAEAEAHSEILGRYASPSSNTTNDEVHNDDDSTTRRSSTRDNFMKRFLQDSNNHNDSATDDEQQLDSTNNSTLHNNNDESRMIPPSLPVEMPAWDKEFSSGGELGDDNININNNKEVQQLLREGDARARLDELIANVRRQGDDKRYATELLDAHNNNTPTKTIATFDPSSMYAARRAELKKMKLDEEVAAAEEQARALSSFKALPLPGGVQVKNNPFASTQSFEMKQVGSVEKLVRRDSKLNDKVHNKSQQQYDESSSVCSTFGSGTYDESTTTKISGSYNNNNTVDTSFTNYSESYANEEDRVRAKQLRAEKKMKKKQLLDAVNQTIMAEDMNEPLAEGDGDDDVRSTTASQHINEGCYDVVEDPSKLRQDIARLEAKLKQKKTQRLAILNDIVDIDLDAPFDRLLSGSSGDDNDGIRRIIDRLKKQVCGSVNDFQDVNTSLREDDEISSYEQHEHTTNTRASLFERQEEWARQREQKLFEARLQSEANAMQGITGRPQLSHAARSWRKAKESHDTTLKRCAEIEERKQQEKEAKEKATNELKMKELEELQRQASLAKLNKSSSIKSDMNKEEQMKRLEMLSKPRQTREPHQHSSAAELDDIGGSVDKKKTTSEIFGGSHPKPNKQKPSNPFSSKSIDKRVVKTVNDVLSSSALGTSANNDVKERPDELFHGKHSFSDMSDKEFAKLVRRIEKQAAMSSSAKMMKNELANK